jgi:hypothetical protein
MVGQVPFGRATEMESSHGTWDCAACASWTLESMGTSVLDGGTGAGVTLILTAVVSCELAVTGDSAVPFAAIRSAYMLQDRSQSSVQRSQDSPQNFPDRGGIGVSSSGARAPNPRTLQYRRTYKNSHCSQTVLALQANS